MSIFDKLTLKFQDIRTGEHFVYDYHLYKKHLLTGDSIKQITVSTTATYNSTV
jgi:hypothetical protein